MQRNQTTPIPCKAIEQAAKKRMSLLRCMKERVRKLPDKTLVKTLITIIARAAIKRSEAKKKTEHASRQKGRGELLLAIAREIKQTDKKDKHAATEREGDLEKKTDRKRGRERRREGKRESEERRGRGGKEKLVEKDRQK